MVNRLLLNFMIYKQQFLLSVDYKSYVKDYDGYVQFKKKEYSANLGVLIGEKEGFEKVENSNPMEEHYELEIIVFKRSKWATFTKNLKEYLMLNTRDKTLDLMTVSKILKELEENK